MYIRARGRAPEVEGVIFTPEIWSSGSVWNYCVMKTRSFAGSPGPHLRTVSASSRNKTVRVCFPLDRSEVIWRQKKKPKSFAVDIINSPFVLSRNTKKSVTSSNRFLHFRTPEVVLTAFSNVFRLDDCRRAAIDHVQSMWLET